MRRKPYTAIGIRRVTCCVAGCEEKARYQWQCCATGNKWMAICPEHDVALNDAALKLIGHPERAGLIEAYQERVRHEP